MRAKYRLNWPIKSKLEERSVPIPETGCWEWIAGKDRAGYGRIWAKKNRTAHTVSYETYVGVIPEGMHVLHNCDNPACINPDHLWLGTHDDNMADKAKKKRYPKKGPDGRFMEKFKRTDK
jgi:hypothetical protein